MKENIKSEQQIAIVIGFALSYLNLIGTVW